MKITANILTLVALAGFLASCGDAFPEDKSGGDDSEVADDKGPVLTGTDSKTDTDTDPDGSVTSGPQAPLIQVELRSGSIAHDLGVARAKIDGKGAFFSDTGAKIGIEDVYYGTNLIVGNTDKEVEVEVEGWAIASTAADKSWLETTCAPQTPGPDGTVTEICEVAGPIMDARKEIEALAAEATDADVLKVLETKFPDQDFEVVATGKLTYKTSGNKVQTVELKAP